MINRIKHALGCGRYVTVNAFDEDGNAIPVEKVGYRAYRSIKDADSVVVTDYALTAYEVDVGGYTRPVLRIKARGAIKAPEDTRVSSGWLAAVLQQEVIGADRWDGEDVLDNALALFLQ